jgi:signal transduction histidine kinase
VRGFAQAFVLALGLLILGATLAPAPAVAANVTPSFDAVEAAPGVSWADVAPPSSGWVAVTLPDVWTVRWPDHSGVTWYRLRWQESAPLAPRGLYLRDMTMAGAIYLNGIEIDRDAHLVEPLSRSWNVPRYFSLHAPLLKEGRNELLVRVSGLSNFQPSLGAVSLGPPDALRAQADRDRLVRRSLQWVSIGITSMMAVLFGMLWLLRRSEVTYGWFSLFCLLWLPFSYNYVALSAWPFDSTDAFQRANHVFLLASVGAFFMFALHFCNRRAEWLRFLAGAPLAAFALALVIAPQHSLVDVRNATVIGGMTVYIGACVMIVHNAFTQRRAEAVVLALALAITAATGIHDTLLFVGLLPGNNYYASLASAATVIGISFALTWRLVRGLRMVENFNEELRQRVDEASARLSQTLHRQHEVELVQTRLAERLNLVRDLHDGLGMTLNGHISALQQDRDGPSPGALWALREVNDDLRLIIESSAFDDAEELSERIVPLRHRCTRLLETAGIECRWHVDRLAGCKMGARRGLDFLRLLQEALTNVLRHSRATQVNVRIAQSGAELLLSVHDNGQGLDVAGVEATGMGMSNMRERARRLDGHMEIRSTAGSTVLELRCPISLEQA